MRLLRFVLLGALLFSGRAVGAEPDLKAVIARVGEEFILPRFEMLADAAGGLSDAIHAACAAPSDDGLAEVRARFHVAADLWSRLEFIRQGPLETDANHERLAFWPDQRNAVARGLAELMAGTEAVTVADLGSRSAAVQGLTALERLVSNEATFAPASRACAVAGGVAEGYAARTRAIATDWPAELARAVASPRAAREAVSRLVTDLLAEFHVMIDTKLRKPLGRETGQPIPGAFEGVRSGRTVRALTMNLAGIEETIRGLIDETSPQSRRILSELADIRVTLEDVPDLAEGDGADFRLRADRLIAAIRRAQASAYQDLPELLGITLGFNALDGD